jgi:hypothetical protein
VTVCTNYVAGVDLVEHGLPATITETRGDVEVLVSEMVELELEHERIGLATVDARVVSEEGDEIGGALSDERLFPAYGVRDIALAVRRVVLSFVGRSAGATVIVSLPAGPATPGEA